MYDASANISLLVMYCRYQSQKAVETSRSEAYLVIDTPSLSDCRLLPLLKHLNITRLSNSMAATSRRVINDELDCIHFDWQGQVYIPGERQAGLARFTRKAMYISVCSL
jgi:hypothetical protein